MKKVFLLLAVLLLSFDMQAQSVEKTDSIATAGERTYETVDVMPEFPGGMPALMGYLRDNIKYPSKALAEKRQGRAIVRFIVEKDGSISEAQIAKSAGDIYLDTEALRVVNKMPKWSPGQHKGKVVRVFFHLPITFKLN